jgi:hypothetical protein
MTVHLALHVARMPCSGGRLPYLSLSDLLHLSLALGSALTGTPWGVTMSVIALFVLMARHAARRALTRSVAARRGVLAATERPGALHPAGRAGEGTARA